MKQATQDLRAMYDLVLLQQSVFFPIKNRADRLASRDALQRLFIDLQSAMAPDLTLEIGAMRADFSLAMAKKGIKAFAFEANSYNFAEFSPQIKALDLPLHYLNLAISDRDGTVDFHLQKSINGVARSPIQGNNSLMLRSSANGDVEYETLTIPSARLDSFIAQNALHNSTFSLWIDVEGGLDKVTAGFGAALANCQSILVEVEEMAFWDGQMLYPAVMDFFIAQGFVPVARDFESRHQFNLLFLAKAQLQQPKVRKLLMRYFSSRQS